MSNFYTDLTLTNFPDSSDNFTSMLDMVSGDLSLVNQFRQYMLDGDFASADSILSSIADSNKKLLRAENINAWQEAIIAMERLYRDDYEEFTDEVSAAWEILVSNFMYVGEYSAASSCLKNNMVYYEDAGNTVSYIYIAMQDVPVGILPTDTVYWRQFTVKGIAGAPPTSLSYIGEWYPNVPYSKYKLVRYNGKLWTGVSETDTYTPPPKEGADYCKLNLDFSPLDFDVEYIEPSIPTGDLWIQLLKDKIYGIRGIGEVSPFFARTDDSIGLGFKVNASIIDSDFDNCYPYKDIVEVEDSFGNRFMRFPKFYTYRNGSELKISGSKHGDEWLLNPCFTYNGIERDYVYVGKYEASAEWRDEQDVFSSKSNKWISTYFTMSLGRTLCSRNGAGYFQNDLWVRQMLLDLFTVEFATSANKNIMAGYTVSNPDKLNSGSTDRVLSPSGSPVNNLSGKYPCKYRGVENFIGNVEEFLDGVLLDGTSIYVCYNPSFYSDTINENYVLLNYNISTSELNARIKHLGNDDSNRFALFPISEQNSTLRYYSSGFYYAGVNSKIMVHSPFCTSGIDKGIFYITTIPVSSQSFALRGTRLCAYEII